MDVLGFLGAEHIPVAQGAAGPMIGSIAAAAYFHGENGLGNVTLPRSPLRPVALNAAYFLLQTAAHYPGEVTLVCLAPLVNVALACKISPEIMRLYRRIVIMGGAEHAGNVTPVVEANFGNDPIAAQMVLEAGLQPLLVGLDVTHRVLLRDRDLSNAHDSGSPSARLARDLCRFYLGRHGQTHGLAGETGGPMHDPLAVLATACPEIVTALPMAVEVECFGGGLTRGQLVCNREGTREAMVGGASNYDGIIRVGFNAHVCVGVNAPRALELILARTAAA